MKKIHNYRQLEKKLEKIEEALPRCLGFIGFNVDRNGCLEIENDQYLQPEEAIRLGKALLEFYQPELLGLPGEDD